jgi:hypothetical protein
VDPYITKELTNNLFGSKKIENDSTPGILPLLLLCNLFYLCVCMCGCRLEDMCAYLCVCVCFLFSLLCDPIGSSLV